MGWKETSAPFYMHCTHLRSWLISRDLGLEHLSVNDAAKYRWAGLKYIHFTE